jgi:hypothetical protein
MQSTALKKMATITQIPCPQKNTKSDEIITNIAIYMLGEIVLAVWYLRLTPFQERCD